MYTHGRVLPREAGHSGGCGRSGADGVVDGSAAATQRGAPVGQRGRWHGIREAGD